MKPLSRILLVLALLMPAAASSVWGQIPIGKERNPGYVPTLYQSRASIRAQIGLPYKLYTPESDWAKFFPTSDRFQLLVNVKSEAYLRNYGGLLYYLDVFYDIEGRDTGLIGPARAVGFALTPYDDVVYPDLLPTIPWFKPLCAAGCDEMTYRADGEKYALICPPHPKAKDLDEARRQPLVPCLRVDFLPKKPHLFIIHYAEFRPAMEELLAEGPVEHQKRDTEYASQ